MSTEIQNTQPTEAVPFFARFLETQQPEQSKEEGEILFQTLKFPSDHEE